MASETKKERQPNAVYYRILECKTCGELWVPRGPTENLRIAPLRDKKDGVVANQIPLIIGGRLLQGV